MKLREWGIDCSGACIKAAHHDGVCSCVCGGVNHAAMLVSARQHVDIRDVFGHCTGRALSTTRHAYIPPPAPFKMGQKVVSTEKAEKALVVVPRRFGYVFGGSDSWDYPHKPGPPYIIYRHAYDRLRVIQEGTGTPVTFHPSFWEAA